VQRVAARLGFTPARFRCFARANLRRVLRRHGYPPTSSKPAPTSLSNKPNFSPPTWAA
jgi:hypothetical protein